MDLVTGPLKGKKTLRAALVVIVLVGLFATGAIPVIGRAIGPSVASSLGRGKALAQEGTGATFTDLSLDPTPLIAEVYNLIRYNSVKEPDPMQLAENAIQGMIVGLRDYWAAYYTSDDMKAFTSNVTGAFGGIGVRVTEDPDGYLLIASVMTGYPADKAGILAGDLITAIDGADIKGQGLEAADLIRGEPGTKVTLTIKRQAVADPLTFELIRETIEVTSVESRIIAGNVGYISVSGFDQDTDEEFDQALQSLAAAGAKGIIIDLRGNPGGLLNVTERMVERFLPERYPYLRIQWTWRTDIKRSRVGDGYTPLEGVPYLEDGRFPYPVAILVNGYSASASEIFTASLQEWGVARVFGERTFGKGCVQTIYSLSNGGGMKVTTAVWKTGLGRDIDGVGVIPDEVISDPNAPGPDAATEPGFIPVPTLWVFRKGSAGTDVMNLQMRLTQLGYDAGQLDGVFSAQTEQALKQFQAAVGIPQTGATGAATVAALNRARIADHPAGKKAGAGGTGTGGGSGSGTSPTKLPPAPAVTGDQVTDRAIEWLQGQIR